MWVAARERITGAELEPRVAAAFQAAMDHVDLAWSVLRGLFAWADQQPDSARREMDSGPLLELVQGELSEEFAGLAHRLARVVLDWPGWQDAGPENLDIDALARYFTLLRLAAEAGSVSAPLRNRVRQVATALEPPGESSWFARMGRLVQAIVALEPAPPYRDGTWARRALDVLLYDLPEEQVRHGRLFLLGEIERIHTSAGQAPPAWVTGLRAEFSAPGGP